MEKPVEPSKEEKRNNILKAIENRHQKPNPVENAFNKIREERQQKADVKEVLAKQNNGVEAPKKKRGRPPKKPVEPLPEGEASQPITTRAKAKKSEVEQAPTEGIPPSGKPIRKPRKSKEELIEKI